jgi:hypothetical protein
LGPTITLPTASLSTASLSTASLSTAVLIRTAVLTSSTTPPLSLSPLWVWGTLFVSRNAFFLRLDGCFLLNLHRLFESLPRNDLFWSHQRD